MAAIRIDVDGTVLATVNVDGMHLLHVSVHSSLDVEAPASLEIHGGTYGEQVSGHRIWVSDNPLAAGQSVKVSLIECDGPFDQGRTPADMFPEDDSSEEFDFTMTEARAAELRARPRLKDAFSMEIETSSGTRCPVNSDPQNDRFTFMVLWDFTRPLQARLSVRTYCAEDVILRGGGTDHLQETMPPGGFATCLIG
ncbi:hypothetical protein INH39_32950 [Massilia violaceinigra]|uniref:Uncharacterized protein n=1 Tax=Massilia violaceinigra TaxID=2045208 RepID=A0ABY4ABX2_9BURK|nr:hypothetical protein [Massilia violaceinigra]UOD30098.1 hypothetical protein INH39_32950 [Massilia violaceinigra]